MRIIEHLKAEFEKNRHMHDLATSYYYILIVQYKNKEFSFKEINNHRTRFILTIYFYDFIFGIKKTFYFIIRVKNEGKYLLLNYKYVLNFIS